MYTYPFEILKKRLTDTVTVLREVDLFMDQTSDADNKSMLKALPGAYIEFLPADMKPVSNSQIQSGQLDFIIHLVTENLNDTGTKRLKTSAPKDHMQIFDRIYIALHGFSAKLSFLPEFAILLGTDQDERVFNTISRVQPGVPAGKKGGIMTSAQRFRCIVYDHAATKEYTSPAPDPGLEIQHDIE